MPGDLAALIESNVAEFLLTMGMIGGGSERADDEITWTAGGSPIGYHNAVVRCDASQARGRALVEEWRTELWSRSLPGSWHLSPTMWPNELAEYLTEAGFEDGGDEPAMAAVLSDLSDMSRIADLDIARVNTDDDLDEYRNVLATGFGEGPREADWVASVFAQAGVADEGPWRHIVGRVGREPAATASLLLTHGTAGIYFVCTRPEFRRRGFGAAMTSAAMVEAAHSGAKHAVLGSSPMGQRIYERLGFRTIFSYRLFEFEP
jgi:ribosomal protein S18 acetylase RimI-like enzyme